MSNNNSLLQPAGGEHGLYIDPVVKQRTYHHQSDQKQIATQIKEPVAFCKWST